MGFIAKQGAGGFISGNAFVKSSSRGRLAFMKSVTSAALVNTDFVMVWRTTGADETVTMPFGAAADVVDINIDWGDGNQEHAIVKNPSHVYALAGDYEVSVDGTYDSFYFRDVGDKLKLIEVKNWGGDHGMTGLYGSHGFMYGCSRVVITATDVCDFGTTGWADSAFRELSSQPTDGLIRMTFGSLMTQLGWIFRNCPGDVEYVDCDVSAMTSILYGAPEDMSTANYDALLIDWGAQTVVTCTLTMSPGVPKYTDGGAAKAGRDSLVAQGWTITDGGPVA